MTEPFRLSVSKTKCFLHCKKQYKFSYVLKMPKKEFEYHTYGKFCHRILELFHLQCMTDTVAPLNKVMAASFKESVEEYKEKLTQDMRVEAYAMCNEYLKILAAKKSQNTLPTVLGCEQEFQLIIQDKVKIVGVIDKVEIHPDNVLHIADYKTTKNKKYLKNDWFQLLTYALVMLENDPTITKVRGSYILLRHNFEHITKEFTVPEILAVKDSYVKYADQMANEKEFEANPNFLCQWCEFLEFCDEGKKKVQPDTTFGEVEW